MTKPSIVFYIFDEFDNFLDVFVLRKNSSSEVADKDCRELCKTTCPEKYSVVFTVDGYFMSVFTKFLKISSVYSKMVTINFMRNIKNTPGVSEISAKFQLVKPKAEALDYAWNDRINFLLFERLELENAMSWLSTLGGAFSALGDSFENCAKVAGKISIQQFKIAFRLGEPPLVARCKVYMALSLIQLGKLNTAKSLIQEQYQLAKNFNDLRLTNMCKGVWAKLQYIYKEKKNKAFNN